MSDNRDRERAKEWAQSHWTYLPPQEARIEGYLAGLAAGRAERTGELLVMIETWSAEAEDSAEGQSEPEFGQLLRVATVLRNLAATIRKGA